MISDALPALAAIVAGAIAAVSGFGIGSILTPLLSVEARTKTAIAAVSIPHFVGTALRFWWLRGSFDRCLFWSFGVMSAAGGLAGAFLHAWASDLALGVLFGSLLIFAGGAELTGLSNRVQLGRRAAWIAGGLSGLFGGLVGNQGGIRSTALLGSTCDGMPSSPQPPPDLQLTWHGRRSIWGTQAGAISLIWPGLLIATIEVVLGPWWARTCSGGFRRRCTGDSLRS